MTLIYMTLEIKFYLKKFSDSKEKICHILKFFFDKGENAKKLNIVYGPVTVEAKPVQFLILRKTKIDRKRSWSMHHEPVQTVAKPGW